jgi:hypothetical protein
VNEPCEAARPTFVCPMMRRPRRTVRTGRSAKLTSARPPRLTQYRSRHPLRCLSPRPLRSSNRGRCAAPRSPRREDYSPGRRKGLHWLAQIRTFAISQRDEFSLCTSKFESDMPSHGVGLCGVISRGSTGEGSRPSASRCHSTSAHAACYMAHGGPPASDRKIRFHGSPWSIDPSVSRRSPSVSRRRVNSSTRSLSGNLAIGFLWRTMPRRFIMFAISRARRPLSVARYT